MKKLIAALLALTLILSLTACGETEPQTETIYVQTQSVRTIGEGVIRTDYTYGKTGKPVTIKLYLNDILYRSVAYRTSNGVSYMTVTDSNGESTTQTTNTVYDDQGRVSILEISVGATTVSRSKYVYDENDRVIKAETLTASGTVTTVYEYDANGETIAQEVSDTNDDSFARTEYTYDERGYVTKECVLNKDGALVSASVYTYEGEQVRIQTKLNSNEQPTGEVVRCEYDEHGNLVKEITYIDDEVAQTIVNVYEAMEVPVTEK